MFCPIKRRLKRNIHLLIFQRRAIMMRRAISSFHDCEYRVRNTGFNLEQGKEMFGKPSQLYGQVDTVKSN